MSDNWRTHAKYYSQFFKVHAIDQRNHGKSFHSHHNSYEIMSKDLKYYFEYHKIKKSIILGHSMGGKTSMYFSCMYPKLVDSLIVVDIAPKKYDIRHKYINVFKGLNYLNSIKISSRKDAFEILFKYLDEKHMVNFLLKNLYRNDRNQLKLRCNIDTLSKKIEELGLYNENKLYPGKCIFIAGEKSDYIKKNDHNIIKMKFPESSIVYMSGLGHWPHSEAPKQFREVVNKFLRL